jgi:hypothetical protein
MTRQTLACLGERQDVSGYVEVDRPGGINDWKACA